MRVEPVVLTGRHVRLEPLTMAHHAALCEVGLEDEIWRWGTGPIRSPHDMRAYIETALAWQAAGTALPFVTIHATGNRVVGSTRFANIEPAHRRLEIGWTWVAPAWQRTAVNTEAKYLMLRHAFDVLGCIRVEFKTDALNEKSRRALLRIGAREEGTLRSHMLVTDDRRRDSVYFSILDAEWPDVRDRLEAMLDR